MISATFFTVCIKVDGLLCVMNFMRHFIVLLPHRFTLISCFEFHYYGSCYHNAKVM